MKLFTSMLWLMLCLCWSQVQAKEPLLTETKANLNTIQWIHGAQSCQNDQQAAIQVERADESSYVLRQNKCITFEAPFMYVLLGHTTMLLVDTGASEAAAESPIFNTVKALFEKHKGTNLPLLEKILVVHTHSHNDHRKGDAQFLSNDLVEVVGTSNDSLAKQLGLNDWPNHNSTLDLGNRTVTFIPAPGHQEQSIAIYDSQTQWLLTGDTLYPGVIRVKNWDAFTASIERLFKFSQHHAVSAVLGAHIEMNANTGKPYKIGQSYQPHEASLPLTVEHLAELNSKLMQIRKPKKLRFELFVVSPLSRLEKLIIKVATSMN